LISESASPGAPRAICRPSVDLLTGRSAEKLRINPRKTWYSNLEEVITNGEYEVTFV
jgi:hypothetical protein